MRMTPARTSWVRPIAVLLALLTGGTLAGCGSSASPPPAPAASAAGGAASGGSRFPATIVAANGTVRVTARPTAIVSLLATATEMLYAIGAGGQVKAADQYSDYPPQAPHTSLSGFTPNVEAIVAYRPDLVITDSDRGGLTKRLAAFSIPVLVLPAPTRLAEVYAEFDELGRATGQIAGARAEVEKIRTQIQRIVASTPRPTAPVSYYYELEQDYYSVTSATFVGQLLGLLGLHNIADAGGMMANGGYPQLSAEYIVKANPDYIFLADTICCHQNAASVARRAGWSGLAAVAKHHVVPLSDDIASRWGPRIVDLLRIAADAVAGR